MNKQPLILLCGIASDPCLEAAGRAARFLSVPHVFLDQRESGDADIDFTHTSEGVDGVLTYRGVTYELGTITGVFARLRDVAALPEFTRLPTADKRRHSGFHHRLSAWMDLAPARVVSAAQPACTDLAQAAQPQIIRRFFPVPDSLLTNDRAEALRFFHKHTRVLVKTLTRPLTMELSGPKGMEHLLCCMRAGPVLLQRRIEGRDIGATTVGGHCSAVAATGGADISLVAESFPLPTPIEDCCVRLTRSLRLDWARVNLRLTSEGTYYCLGIDPAPAVSTYSPVQGARIAHNLVKYLAGVS